MLTRLSPGIGAMVDAAREHWFRVTHDPTGLAHPDPTATPATVERAIGLGVDYLAKRQRRDGAWTDFLLYPGASVEWITAHVAFVLEDVPAAADLTAGAATYLASVGASDGGWGYCRRVAKDCDSTAQALIVLHRHGIEAPRFVVDWLVGAQARSGGFPTYPTDRGNGPRNGWQREHADVTLAVVEALRRLGVAPQRRQRALAWLNASTPQPIVRGYWWPRPAYAAWLQTRIGFRATEAAAEAAKLLREQSAISELAMLASAAMRDDELSRSTVTSAVTTLLAEQSSDGSWQCSPVLRVTDPRWTDGAEPSGPVFAGARRVFSTAHAVASLAAHGRYASRVNDDDVPQFPNAQP